MFPFSPPGHSGFQTTGLRSSANNQQQLQRQLPQQQPLRHQQQQAQQQQLQEHYWTGLFANIDKEQLEEGVAKEVLAAQQRKDMEGGPAAGRR